MYSTLRCFESCPRPPVSFLTTLSLNPRRPVNVNLRFAEFYAPVFGVLRFVDQLGNMQQRLGRNAAAVQAHAAGVRFGVNQRDLHSEVSGEKCGGVASRASADYCDVQGSDCLSSNSLIRSTRDSP